MPISTQLPDRGVTHAICAANDGPASDIGHDMSAEAILFELKPEFEVTEMATAAQHDRGTKGARKTGDATWNAAGSALNRSDDAFYVGSERISARIGKQSLDTLQAGSPADGPRDQEQAERLHSVSIISKMVTRAVVHAIVDAKQDQMSQEKRSELTKYVRALDLLEAPVADELLALDRDGTRCFGFNATASMIWRMIETPLSLDEIVSHISKEFDVENDEARNDIRSLLSELTKKGLVREIDGADHVEA